MNRKITLALVFLVSCIVIAYVGFEKVHLQEYKQFALKDTANINRIEISNKGKTLLLEKQAGTWKSNTIKIRSEAIRFFLESLQQLSFKTFVPKNEVVKVNHLLDNQACKVKIFENNCLKKSFLVGSPTADSSGTYMRLSDSEQPFIMHIAGFGGDLTNIFLNDVELWRDNLIFNYLASDIASVEVQFLQKPDYSFLLKTNPLQVWHAQQKLDSINQEAVNQYLSYFMNLRYCGVESQIQKNSLLKTTAIHKINVIDTKGKATTIQTFARFEKDNTLDMNVLYAIINNNPEVLKIQYISLDLITKKVQYFSKK